MAHAEKKPMVLSILIPSYNADCTRLMADLASQCAAHAATHPDFSYEILVGDDASSRQDLTALNRQTAESLGVRYLLMDENPSAAAFFQSRYEELRNRLAVGIPAQSEDITDVYGGIGYGEFSRW